MSFFFATLAFLQVGDPLVQRCEGGLDSPTLLRLVAQSGLPLLDAIHSGQHLLLQVIDFTLEQVFEAVGLHGVVTATELLRGKEGEGGGETL